MGLVRGVCIQRFPERDVVWGREIVFRWVERKTDSSFFSLAVMSFMSTWGPSRNGSSQTPGRKRASSATFALETPPLSNIESPDTMSPGINNASPAGTPERRSSRPASTVFSHRPPQVQVSQNTPAELQPIFAYLNSHANKLYQEGYFLKLNDLDASMCFPVIPMARLKKEVLTGCDRWPRMPGETVG